MHSIWFKVPAYLIGIIALGCIGLSGFSIVMDNHRQGNDNKNKKPEWLGVLILFFTIVVLCPSYFQALDEKRIVAAFAELVVAYTLFYVVPIGTIAAGSFSGYKIYLWTKMKWAGWLLGVLVGLMIGFSLHTISAHIPGVGWRIDKIFETMDNSP